MHRVIEIREIEGATSFITQGDANNAPDPEPVMSGNMIGKLVFKIPKIGWVAIAVKRFFGG